MFFSLNVLRFNGQIKIVHSEGVQFSFDVCTHCDRESVVRTPRHAEGEHVDSLSGCLLHLAPSACAHRSDGGCLHLKIFRWRIVYVPRLP